MKMRILLSFLGVLMTLGPVAADTLIVDTGLDYTVYLPDNWDLTRYNATQHRFVDRSGTYPALLSIVRYARNPVDYPTAEEWTKAHFIAYKMTVEYSAEPWGAVLYYDSSTACKQKTLRAAEAYAMFFTTDTTVGCWAEYIRYTASGEYGYELYALSDTADLARNVGLYAAILQGIELPVVTGAYCPAPSRGVSLSAPRLAPDQLFDPIGRRCSTVRGTVLPSGVYLEPHGRRPAVLP